MYFTVNRCARIASRRASASSPGSIRTASRVSGQPTTKPFLSRGGTALTSTITCEPPGPAFSHYGAGRHHERPTRGQDSYERAGGSRETLPDLDGSPAASRH